MSVDLAAERLNRGMSIRQLAEKAELTAPTVTRAEQGEAVHPASAKKLADFYGYRVTEIWPIKDAPPPVKVGEVRKVGI